MISFFTKLIGFVAGGVGPFFTWLTTRDDAARDEALARIDAWLVSLQSITQFKATQFGWVGTRILFFGFALGPLIHSFMLYLDSCGQILFWPHRVGSWNIVTPPPPFDDLERLIILSFFATTIAGGVMRSVQEHLQTKTRLEHERALIRMKKTEYLPQEMAKRRAALTAARPRTGKTRVPPLVWIVAALALIIVIAWTQLT